MKQRNGALNLGRLSPFQGPTPFTERDKDWFFGRDRETDEVLSLILGHKVVLIYAQSGAGKTSLINSKIIPELEENGLFVFPVARVRIQETLGIPPEFSETSGKVVKTVHLKASSIITTESSYNPFMYNVLQYLMTDPDPDTDITSQDKINHSSNPGISTLSDFLEEKLVLKGNKTVIEDKKGVAIIFDQLEELFRSSRDRSRETQIDFFNQIARALEREDLSLRVILVIREDYLAQLDPFAFILPEKLRPRFRLDRLNKEEAREALEKPLFKTKEFFKDPGINERIDELFRKPHENMGSELKTGMMLNQTHSLGLTEKIVNNLCTTQVELPDGGTKEVLGEYVEPIYLQIVGQRLWDKLKLAPTNQITSEHLGDVGDVNVALKDFYEKAILETANNTKINESDIRTWFEKNLITSSGTRGSVHRGVDLTVGMPNKVLDLLEDKHVIRAELRTGGKWYELTHDRLLKPLIESNRLWKNNFHARIKRQYRVLKLKNALLIGISVILVSVLTSAFLDTVSIFSIYRHISSMAVNPTTDIIYAGEEGGNISVIDGATNNINRISLKYKDVSALAVNPTINTIYAGDPDGNISVIDGATNNIVHQISIDYSGDLVNSFTPVSALAVNPTTNKIYAGSSFDHVFAIDGTTNKVKQITLSNQYIGYRDVSALAVNPTTNTIYAGGPYGSISVIDGATNNIVDRIPVDYNVSALAVNPTTNTIYAGDPDGYISVIEGAKNNIVEQINIEDMNDLSALAVNPTTNKIYAWDPAENLFAIDGMTNSNLGYIRILTTATTINPNSNIIYSATSPISGTAPEFYVINGNSNTIISHFPIENYNYTFSN